jgi:hypothetical protein
MALYLRLYVPRYEYKAAHVCSFTMRDPIHTTKSEVIYTHACVYTDIRNANTPACLARIPTYLHSSAQGNSIYHS